MRSHPICVILLCTAVFTNLLTAQSLRPADLVAGVHQEKGFEESFNLFVAQKSAAGIAELDEVGADYEQFTLDASDLATIQKSAPDALQLNLPGDLGRVDLVRKDIFAEGFRVTESSGNRYHKEGLGVHYRGILAGDKNSVVALSIFDDEVSAVISTNSGNYVLGKLLSEDKDAETNHVLYNDQDLPVADLGECATPDTNLPYSGKDLMDLNVTQKDANNCVNVYMEVDNSIYRARGTTQATTDFITGLFNQVAVLYANENINLVMSELFVWTGSDPYNSSSSSGNLNAFQSTRTSFNGNVAHLVSFQASGGIAYVDVLCFPSYAYGFSSIQNGYNNVPNYSWSVNVVAHELGHNFGSQHTHACAWNGNGTPIDGCYTPEGSCGTAPIPQGGGTIMSYCHLTSVGVNFNNGFGSQPGNLIRNRTYNGNCLSACTVTPPGGGGGGGTPPTGCDGSEATVTIVTDFYPGETTWAITDQSGTVMAEGGPYQTRSSTFTQDVCLPNGCYTFTINDSYGDGICCNYGNGSYTINVAGTDVATGGSFGRSTTETFCANNGNDGGTGGDGGDDNGEDTGGDNGECLPLNFTTYQPTTYGSSQDRGTVTTVDANTVQLSGNAWKAVLLDYTVTPATKLAFEFRATRKGEIQGIGFDNNASISSSYTFQLYGTQNWGRRDFKNYTDAERGSFKAYEIPVGQYFTGAFNRLTFANDHDRSPSNALSSFRNIRIFEGDQCVALITPNGSIIDAPETAALTTEQLNVYPNPVSDQLNVAVNIAADADAHLRVIDMTGRTVLTRKVALEMGQQVVPVEVATLPAGAYFLRLEATNGFTAGAKINVLR